MKNIIEIWQPKYSTNEVLIACYKVKKGENLIKFTKAKHLLGNIYCIDSSDIEKCKKITNGKIECFSVPMGELRVKKSILRIN